MRRIDPIFTAGMPGCRSSHELTKAETNKAVIKPSLIPTEHAGLVDLLLLRDRLRQESEHELLSLIHKCQEPIILVCQICRDRKSILQSCKRKWCPCCAQRMAAIRSAELSYIVERMRYPLFVTLTMKNVDDLSSGAVRTLRRAFGKLRHRKVWAEKVLGGVACVEVTNIGNGWHPHLHAVVDCRWLADKTPPIMRGDLPDTIKAKCKAAAIEMQRNWSKCLGQGSSSIDIMRANRNTIAKEVVKYTVKNEDLVLAEGRIGDLIRALDSCRLMTTFGMAHGSKVKEIRLECKMKAKQARIDATPDAVDPCHCGSAEWLPDDHESRQLQYVVAKRRVKPKSCQASMAL